VLRAFFADATLILTDPETDGKHAERLGAIRGFKPFIAEEGRDPR
jgi:hypothetical protein